MAQAVTQIRRGKTPQTPKCQYCQPKRYWLAVVHEASAASEVEASSGHTDSH